MVKLLHLNTPCQKTGGRGERPSAGGWLTLGKEGKLYIAASVEAGSVLCITITTKVYTASTSSVKHDIFGDQINQLACKQH